MQAIATATYLGPCQTSMTENVAKSFLDTFKETLYIFLVHLLLKMFLPIGLKQMLDESYIPPTQLII